MDEHAQPEAGVATTQPYATTTATTDAGNAATPRTSARCHSPLRRACSHITVRCSMVRWSGLTENAVDASKLLSGYGQCSIEPKQVEEVFVRSQLNQKCAPSALLCLASRVRSPTFACVRAWVGAACVRSGRQSVHLLCRVVPGQSQALLGLLQDPFGRRRRRCVRVRLYRSVRACPSLLTRSTQERPRASPSVGRSRPSTPGGSSTSSTEPPLLLSVGGRTGARTKTERVL